MPGLGKPIASVNVKVYEKDQKKKLVVECDGEESDYVLAMLSGMVYIGREIMTEMARAAVTTGDSQAMGDGLVAGLRSKGLFADMEEVLERKRRKSKTSTRDSTVTLEEALTGVGHEDKVDAKGVEEDGRRGTADEGTTE